MRALLFAIGVGLCFFGCNRNTTAQALNPSTAPATAATYAPTAKDTALLWRITAPGNATPSYLFGTIHLIPAEDYFLPTGVVAALNDSEEVLFEIDPRAMQDPSMLFGLMNKINMLGDTSLEDLLTGEQYETVEGYFQKMGLPFMIFKRMKPLFLSAMVGQDLSGMASGGNPMDAMKSYEMELSEIAEAGGKEIGGLETVAFQLSLFDSIPYGAQALMLHDAIVSDQAGESDSDGPNELDRLVGLYKRKAIAEMAKTIQDESAKVAKFEELLLTRRNANWAPEIVAAAKATDAGGKFYAVGAGHLGGDKGVIALLRQAGLMVEPVYK